MAWRGPRTAPDPLLQTHWWRVTVRNYFKRLRRPCAVCGRPIDYDGPTFFVLPNGRKRQNPRSLVVGHIISRHESKRLGWSAQQTMAIANCRPECRSCSNRTGARLGNQVQQAKQPRPPTARPATASRW